MKLLLTTAIWNFAINVAGPFFNVHMLQDLKFNASEIALLSVVSTLCGLLVSNKVGFLSDKLGARKLQLFSMIVIPLLPLGWIICTEVWQLAILNTFNGIFWGAYNLASFNLLLESMPTNKVPLFSAVYQVTVTLALSLGALVGSGIISIWGFVGVLAASASLRWLSTILFSKFVRSQTKRRISLPLDG